MSEADDFLARIEGYDRTDGQQRATFWRVLEPIARELTAAWAETQRVKVELGATQVERDALRRENLDLKLRVESLEEELTNQSALTSSRPDPGPGAAGSPR